MKMMMNVAACFVLAMALVIASCSKKVDSVSDGSDAASSDSSGAWESGSADAADGSSADGMSGDDAAASGAVPSTDLVPVYFEFDKAALSSSARQALQAHHDFLNAYPQAQVVIEGHCDDRGTDEYNLALGERRANSVKDYLVSLGVQSSRLSVLSYGEERPALLGMSESARSKNRRAEFQVGAK